MIIKNRVAKPRLGIKNAANALILCVLVDENNPDNQTQRNEKPKLNAVKGRIKKARQKHVATLE